MLAVLPTLSSLVAAPRIQSHRWSRAAGQQSIAYERVASSSSAPPVLLLNGFGVGSFHWHRVIETIADDSGATCYGMDYLGQGGSWPVDCADGTAPSEAGLRYAIDDWAEQTVEFLEDVVLADDGGGGGGRVRLVGNSVGGLMAALLAARRPDLVEGVVLLNATPIWGSDLPGWDGRLPAPPVPKAVGRLLFDAIRNEQTIATMLGAVYAEPRAVGGELPRQIREVTDATDGGHAAFASILWSPPAAMPGGNGRFDDLLREVRCPVLLLYGEQDPWVTPPFGRSAYRALAARGGGQDASAAAGAGVQLVSLAPCGHCPQHEAPRATAALVGRWLRGDAELLRGAAGGEGAGGDGTAEPSCSETFAEAFGPVRARRLGAEELELGPWERVLTWALR